MPCHPNHSESSRGASGGVPPPCLFVGPLKTTTTLSTWSQPLPATEQGAQSEDRGIREEEGVPGSWQSLDLSSWGSMGFRSPGTSVEEDPPLATATTAVIQGWKRQSSGGGAIWEDLGANGGVI